MAGKIITDSIFRIGDMLYHIECQSTPDGTMAMRMFEYDIAIALEKAYKGKSPYCVKFPMSAVIYLRPDSSVKDFLSLQVYFPDGQALTYKVPVINVQEYSLDGIFDKQLWLFLPFYVMRYEKQLKQLKGIKNSRQAMKPMLNELQEMNIRLAECAEKNQKFDAYADLVNLIIKITNYLLNDKSTLKKEVRKIMGGKILELHSEKISKKVRAEERKSAISTLIITLKDLSIDQSKAVEQVMKKYSLTRSQAQAVVQANW
ncbi:hypothetical protein [Selenomonas sp. AB3002]|uniref:hypothetical protein n=1 Tax=Selenomonas sp. AB3002 TaxID=1392502 RepID=UPI0004985E78